MCIITCLVHLNSVLRYKQKWFLLEVFPLGMAALLILGVVGSCVAESYERLMAGRHASLRSACAEFWGALVRAGDVIVGGTFTLLYYTYFIVVRRAIDVFACTLNAGGAYTLNADPSLRCWEPGSDHAILVPWAAIALCGYGIGVPLIIGCEQAVVPCGGLECGPRVDSCEARATLALVWFTPACVTWRTRWSQVCDVAAPSRDRSGPEAVAARTRWGHDESRL